MIVTGQFGLAIDSLMNDLAGERNGPMRCKMSATGVTIENGHTTRVSVSKMHHSTVRYYLKNPESWPAGNNSWTTSATDQSEKTIGYLCNWPIRIGERIFSPANWNQPVCWCILNGSWRVQTAPIPTIRRYGGPYKRDAGSTDRRWACRVEK